MRALRAAWVCGHAPAGVGGRWGVVAEMHRIGRPLAAGVLLAALGAGGCAAAVAPRSPAGPGLAQRAIMPDGPGSSAALFAGGAWWSADGGEASRRDEALGLEVPRPLLATTQWPEVSPPTLERRRVIFTDFNRSPGTYVFFVPERRERTGGGR